jgi:hypothetical protein
LSELFFPRVVHVEAAVHHPVTRDELLDAIFYVLLKFQRQINIPDLIKAIEENLAGKAVA